VSPHAKLLHRNAWQGLEFSGRVLGDQPWIVRALLREGRHLGGKIVDERRLDQRVLVQALEDLGRDLARAPAGHQLDAELPRDGGGLLAVAEVGLADVHPQLRRRALARAFTQRHAPIGWRQ